MTVLERREPERLVVLGVLGVADPDQRPFQKPNDGGEHLAAWETG